MPALLNINIVQGDSYELRFRIRTTEGEYVNLTGATILAHIRKRPNGPLMAQFTSQLMDQGTPDGLGGAILTLPPSESVGMLTSGVYDVQLTWPSGTVQTVLAGDMKLRLDVSYVAA